MNEKLPKLRTLNSGRVDGEDSLIDEGAVKEGAHRHADVHEGEEAEPPSKGVVRPVGHLYGFFWMQLVS